MRRALRGLTGLALVALVTVTLASGTGELTTSVSGASAPDGMPPVVSRVAVAPGDQVMAPPPADFGAPAPEPLPPPAELRSSGFPGVVPQGGTWAVIVGINDYPGGRHDLRSAVNDAHDVDVALAGYGVPRSRRVLLTDRQASASTILRAADWLVANSGPDATAVFFFAGHVRKLGSDREALVASDGRLVADTALAAALSPLQARQTWVAVAGCYGGGFTEVLGPGRILTGAAPAHRLAYENTAFGRSYMVEYMVRRGMIEGHASESVERAFSWAAAELRRDSPNRMPVQYDHLGGEMQLGPLAGGVRGQASTADQGSDASGSTSGGSVGGSSEPDPPPSTTEPKKKNTCAQVTLGVVRCGS